MIRDDGYLRSCIWEHSAHVRDLYRRRCSGEEVEMTCAAQAAEILQSVVNPGETLLDVGCGSGYFYRSLTTRNIPVDYFGIDASPALIRIGQEILPAIGLPADRLRVMRIEDLHAEVDHVVCMNVLSNIDNFHKPLERLLHSARKTVILRESCDVAGSIRYVRDDFLDPDVDLKVYVNVYDLKEWTAFIESYGFRVTVITDRRTGGLPEDVIGYPHHWKFFLAERTLV